MAGFFSSLFKKQVSVLGVDVGASSMKVVQIKKRRGKAVLETYGELALGPYGGVEIGRAVSLPPEKQIEALKDLLKESKTTSALCGSALPLTSSLISFISLPPVPDKQLSEVVTIEARKYIPVPLDEVFLDYSIIPPDDTFDGEPADAAVPKSKEVLVVAIHNQFLNEFQALMAGSGLEPVFYELEIFSVIRSIADHGIATIMLIDMGARATKLYIAERGILRASHIINKGSQDITLAISKALSISVEEAETLKRTRGLKGGPEYKELAEIITVNLDYIFYEANATLINYQKKHQKSVGRVFLTGGGVLLKGFMDLAKVSFQTEVQYADPFSKLETPAFLSQELASAGPEFAVAIGAALRALTEAEQ